MRNSSKRTLSLKIHQKKKKKEEGNLTLETS